MPCMKNHRGEGVPVCTELVDDPKCLGGTARDEDLTHEPVSLLWFEAQWQHRAITIFCAGLSSV